MDTAQADDTAALVNGASVVRPSALDDKALQRSWHLVTGVSSDDELLHEVAISIIPITIPII